MSMENARVFPGGGVSAVIPDDPEVTERRNKALGVIADEVEAQMEELRKERAPRHEQTPDGMSRRVREDQEASLGRRKRIPRFHLHEMGQNEYLLALASRFPELKARLCAMSEEMKARKEEYGERCFDVRLFGDCRPDSATREAELVEASLAHFIFQVGNGIDFSLAANLGQWSSESRAALADWMRNPFYPEW